ncbi:unnamed protein product, partial [Rotaria sp. Silwood1]
MFINSFTVFCTWYCAAHQFHLRRHFFTDNFEEQLILYDKSNSKKPLTFDIHLRYVWDQDRLVIIDSLSPDKVLYKVICQINDQFYILGWTRNQTDVTVVAFINTM